MTTILLEQSTGPRPGHMPSPQELLAADPQELRASGMSNRKVATLRALAERFLDGQLSDESLPRMTDEEIEAAQTEVPGIGRTSSSSPGRSPEANAVTSARCSSSTLRAKLKSRAASRAARSAILGLQVDADDEVLRPHLPHDLSIATSSGVPRDDLLEALLRIFVNDMRCTFAPSAAGIHPNPRLCLDVAHIVGSTAVLGDDPEHIAIETIGHRRNARDPGLPADRLDQRRAPAADSQANHCASNPIDQPHERLPNGPPRAVAATERIVSRSHCWAGSWSRRGCQNMK